MPMLLNAAGRGLNLCESAFYYYGVNHLEATTFVQWPN